MKNSKPFFENMLFIFKVIKYMNFVKHFERLYEDKEYFIL